MENCEVFERSLRDTLAKQINNKCREMEHECLAKIRCKIEAKVNALEAEQSAIFDQDIAQKSESISKKFNELNKRFENAVGEQKGAELSINSARIRYDNLTARLKSSGSKLTHLKDKSGQLNSRVLRQSADECGSKYSSGVEELSALIRVHKAEEEKCDELKSKVELSEGDLTELKKSVEDIKQKIMQQNKMKEERQATYDGISQHCALVEAKLESLRKELDEFQNASKNSKQVEESVKEAQLENTVRASQESAIFDKNVNDGSKATPKTSTPHKSTKSKRQPCYRASKFCTQ